MRIRTATGRRQELIIVTDSKFPGDHSCGIERRCRPVKNRFLPTQEWSAIIFTIVGGLGFGCGRQFGELANWRQQQCQNTPTHSRPPTDHSCVGRNLFFYRAASPPNRRRRWRHTVVRFLPTQEWSCGGRECIGEYGIVVARRRFVKSDKLSPLPSPNCQNPPTNYNPKQDHSCEGRNLTV